MLSTSGAELDAALAELGWADMLSDMPERGDTAGVPAAGRNRFARLGSQRRGAADRRPRGTARPRRCPTPAAAGWCGTTAAAEQSSALGGLPLRRVDEGEPLRLADARRAVGWWLVGSARAMLAWPASMRWTGSSSASRSHRFQAVRHRLAETLVAIEGAEATLSLPGEDNPDLTALLAKAAAGKAALTAAKHCQQVLGGIGFTAEHDLHHHVKRALVLDGLLGSSRELTRKAGAGLRARGSAPRLAHL